MKNRERKRPKGKERIWKSKAKEKKRSEGERKTKRGGGYRKSERIGVKGKKWKRGKWRMKIIKER